MISVNGERIQKNSVHSKREFDNADVRIETPNNRIVVLYDPDAPNPCFVHYLAVNGTVVLDYVPPNPPSVEHEYILEELDGRGFTPHDFEKFRGSHELRHDFDPDYEFGGRPPLKELVFSVRP
jgi:hypothetical protein